MGVAIKQKFACPDIRPQIRAGMRIAIKLAAVQNINELKMVRILDTCTWGKYISEALLPLAAANEAIEIVGTAEQLNFDEHGNLV